MKLKYIIGALFLGLLTLSCQREEVYTLSDIKIEKSYLAIDVNGGTVTLNFNANGPWSIDNTSKADWLSIYPTSGGAGDISVSLSAESTKATRNAEISILCGDQTQYVNIVQYAQKTDPVIMTVAEALALIKTVDKGDGGSYNLDGEFYVKGTVCRIDEISPSYGNATFYLSDDGKFVDGKWLEVYRGKWLDNKAYTTGNEFAVGDEITIVGKLMSYKGTPETVQGESYVYAITKSLIGIEGVELLDVEEGEGVTEYPQEGGRIKVSIMTKGEGFSVQIPTEDKSWLHIDDFGGNFVTLAADANVAGDRAVTVTFTTTSGSAMYSCQQTLTQKGAIQEVSVAEFLAAPVGTAQYRVTGAITSIANASYGNIYIKDFSGEVYVYGIGAKGDFEKLGLNVGDVVTLVGQRGEYKGTAQMTKAVHESSILVYEATIAEVLAAEDGGYYRVTGEVSSIANETYGNIYITDGTNELYIYGCYPGWGAKGDDRKGVVAAEGIKVGDKLTVFGPKSTYKGTPQINGGIFWSLTPAN
ncbi:MAG: BACON domain-containing protein [Bacteroidales bacterium]|nr:BACON domain-containing protein [Bacteroidales bacterium]